MSSFIRTNCTSFLFFIIVMNTSQASLYRMAHYRSLFNKTEIRWKNVWFIKFNLDMRNCRIHIDNWLPTSLAIKNSQVGNPFVCFFTTPTIRFLLENWLGPRKLVHRNTKDLDSVSEAKSVSERFSLFDCFVGFHHTYQSEQVRYQIAVS